MAIPSYVGSTFFTTGSVSLATIDAGSPPTAGDLVIVSVTLDGNDSLSVDQAVHCPADWHRHGTGRQGGTNSLFWKIWSATDSTTAVFSWPGSPVRFLVLACFRGTDQARPIARHSIRRYTSSSVDWLAETTPVADCLGVALLSLTPRLTVVSTPSGWTNRLGNGLGNATTGSGQNLYTQGFATSGTSTGTASTTLSASGDLVLRMLVLQPPQTAVRKDIRVKTGSTTSPTSTGNQDITGLGFDVKALILYCANRGADSTSPDAEFMRGIGADDSVTAAAQRSAGIWHDSGTSNDFGYSDSASIVKMYFAGNSTLGSPSLEAQYSRISDGFRLNWTAVQASGVQFNWIALGGSDFRAVVGAKQVSTSPLTGLPWRPDLVHTLSQNFNSDSDQIRSEGQLSAGWMDMQSASSFCVSVDLNAGSSPNILNRDDSFIANTLAGTTQYLCGLEQTTSDGWAWSGTSTDYFWYLAMYFGNNTAFPYSVETIDGETTGVAGTTQQVPRFAVSQTKAAKQAMLVHGTSGTSDQDVSSSGYVEGHVELNGEYPRNQSSLAFAKITTVSERRYKPTDGLMFHTAGDLDTLAKIGTWTDSRTITWSTNSATLYAFGLVTIGEIGTVYGTASDTVAVTDSLAIACRYVRPVTDTAIVTDTVATARVIARTVSSDTIAISDTVTTTRTLGRVPTTDSAVVTDTLTNTRSLGRSANDTIAVSDTVSTARVLARAISDTVAIADALTNTRSLGRSLSTDTAVVTDALTNTRSLGRSVSDTIAVSDTVSTARVIANTTSDTVAISDAAVRIALVFAQAPIDAVAVADAMSTALVFGKTLSDSVAVADAVDTARVIAPTVSDAVVIAETVSIACVFATVISDACTISDAAGSARIVGTEKSDTVTTADAVSIAASYAITFVDTVTVSDVAVRSATKPAVVGDSISAVDSVSRTLTLGVVAADAVVATDAVAVAASYALTISDAVETTDEALRGAVFMSGTDDFGRINPIAMYAIGGPGPLLLSGDPSAHRNGSVLVARLGDFVTVTDQLLQEAT